MKCALLHVPIYDKGHIVDQDRFAYDTYLVRKKVFTIFGEAFHIYGPDEQVVLYSKLKAFKLKEDIRLYTGEDMTEEVLSIQARQIIDFAAAYDVWDPVAQEKVGAVLTGICGPKAHQTLSAAGIEVVVGCSGTVLEAVEHFKTGRDPAAAVPGTRQPQASPARDDTG